MNPEPDVAAAYDELADLYTDFVRDHLAGQPFDRAVLDLFTELVDAGPVADLGCGPGRITRYLTDAGLDVAGYDISPRMLEIARRDHPDLRFDAGSAEAIAYGDGALAGLLAWYSLIHLPPERMPGVLSEFARVLCPRGFALVAFQATDEPGEPEAFDHRVTRAYLWSPETLAASAREHGLVEVCRMVRRPDPSERFLQAYLLLRNDG